MTAERVRARDPEALRAVVRAYLPQVLRAGRGAGLDAQEAEELAQETFRAFVETAERFEGRSHVRTWLFGILYRKLAEMRRALGRARRFESIDGERDDLDGNFDGIDELMDQRFGSDGFWSTPPATPAEDFERAELRREIASCLEASPLPQRMAFVLREVHGFDTDEICEILGVTPSNLGVMLFRLRNRTRECLEIKGLAASRTT